MIERVTRKLNLGRKSLLVVAGALAVFAPAGMPAVAMAQAAAASEAHAKGDVAGDWQGTLQAGKALRIIVRFTKSAKGWEAKFYSIDQTPQPFSASGVTVDGSSVKLSVETVGGTYVGTVSADGNSMAGTWTQGPNPLPLTLVRATKETAWEIPAAAPPPKLMPVDADPSFEVATIKPSDPSITSMQGLVIDGRNFKTKGSSLADLMAFAYQVQAKQIINAPEWMDKDRYDVDAVPDVDGAPNPAQVRLMIRKLVEERFKLKYHGDKKELSAFVLAIGKTGSKLKPTENPGPLPGIGMRPAPGGLTMIVRNAAISDFTGFLQSLVLDRPVVDQTGLKEKYDFSVTFTPDDSLFNGHPPRLPAKSESVEAAPSLFEGIQKDLGLKLEAQKTLVDVIAIDHVEKPSAN